MIINAHFTINNYDIAFLKYLMTQAGTTTLEGGVGGGGGGGVHSPTVDP